MGRGRIEKGRRYVAKSRDNLACIRDHLRMGPLFGEERGKKKWLRRNPSVSCYNIRGPHTITLASTGRQGRTNGGGWERTRLANTGQPVQRPLFMLLCRDEALAGPCHRGYEMRLFSSIVALSDRRGGRRRGRILVLLPIVNGKTLMIDSKRTTLLLFGHWTRLAFRLAKGAHAYVRLGSEVNTTRSKTPRIQQAAAATNTSKALC